MKISTIALALALAVAFSLPAYASAATSAGVKPGSFFYFFDTTFEKIGLFFTFNPEKKVRKALEYADERLAEIEAIAEEKDPDAVKTAIADYENNVALATEKSKEVKDKGQAESLLASIKDNASKNQEVLSAVLIKVPEEAREAIKQAIEASRKGQEEAAKQISELKGEVEQLKQEVAGLKAKDEEREKRIEELSKQKTESPATQQKISTPQTSVTTTQKPEIVQPQTSPKTEPAKITSTITLPNGAVVEMDTNGNILRYIKEALVNTTTQTPTTSVAPPPAVTPTQVETLEITSVTVTPDMTSTKIEWQTNKPTSAKVFISGGGLSSKIYNSESGISTRHIVNITGLNSGTNYSYEIESIAGEQVAKRDSSFSTKPDEYSISVQADKTSIPASGWHSINFKVSTLKNGQGQTNQNISVVTPDFTQNKTSTGDFTYYPKTIGTHTLIFSWSGVSKSIDIKATEYVKIDPTISLRPISYDGNDTFSPVYDPFEIDRGIVNFVLSAADEPLQTINLWDTKYETDIPNAEFRFYTNGELNQIKIVNTKDFIGKHTFTIKEIKIVGISSGTYRQVTGLPITINFEIKDVPTPEVIPIKTTHTYCLVGPSIPCGVPGVIGSFKIKTAPNRGIQVLCDRIRLININTDGYTAYIYKEVINEGGVVMSPQCPQSSFGSNAGSNETDSNGVSRWPLVLWIDALKTEGIALPAIFEFQIEGLKVKDMQTGIIRDVKNSPIFQLEGTKYQ